MTTTTTAAADRIAFAGYVQAQLERFWEHAGSNAHVWDAEKLARAAVRPRLDTSDAGAYAGAWHVVRNYVTTEFRVWIEEYYAERLTFSEWRARAIAERDAQRTREVEYLESRDYCLDELAAMRALLERRDELIMSARERGATWAEIGAQSGLSRAQLHNIATRHAARMVAERASLADGVPAAWDDDEPF